MRKFLFRLMLFLLLFVFIVGIISISSKIYISNYTDFTIKPTTTNIILGHSQPECGLNDKLISNTENFSQGGESYFYSYQKLKKIVQVNKNIKNVFISFSNNQISVEMNKWTFGDVYVNNYYPKYSFMMDDEDYKMLIKNNLFAVVKADFKSSLNGIKFALKRDKNYLTNRNWGGYLKIEWNKIDSLNRRGYLKKNDLKLQNQLSLINLHYLHKMIDFCKSKKINVVLFRMPIHKNLLQIQNESLFEKIKLKNFKSIPFLDFSHFSLTNKEYADYSHLNNKGASRFSKFFNYIIQKEIYKIKNSQLVLNKEISTNYKLK